MLVKRRLMYSPYSSPLRQSVSNPAPSLRRSASATRSPAPLPLASSSSSCRSPAAASSIAAILFLLTSSTRRCCSAHTVAGSVVSLQQTMNAGRQRRLVLRKGGRSQENVHLHLKKKAHPLLLSRSVWRPARLRRSSTRLSLHTQQSPTCGDMRCA